MDRWCLDPQTQPNSGLVPKLPRFPASKLALAHWPASQYFWISLLLKFINEISLQPEHLPREVHFPEVLTRDSMNWCADSCLLCPALTTTCPQKFQTVLQSGWPATAVLGNVFHRIMIHSENYFSAQVGRKGIVFFLKI